MGMLHDVSDQEVDRVLLRNFQFLVGIVENSGAFEAEHQGVTLQGLPDTGSDRNIWATCNVENLASDARPQGRVAVNGRHSEKLKLRTTTCKQYCQRVVVVGTNVRINDDFLGHARIHCSS